MPLELELCPGRWVGGQHPCFIIAEIGQNHQGDLDVAKRMIRTAKECGADCAKFQKSELEFKFNRKALERPYTSKHSWGKTYGEHKRHLEFSHDQYRELQRYAEEVGIFFTASGMDEMAVEFLHELNVPFFKVGSGDTNNFPYLEKTAKKGECLIFEYQKVFPDIPVGYSGHETGIAISVAAVALGAKVLERHITLDKTWKGSDHSASLEPGELAELVRSVRLVERAMGSPTKQLLPCEMACNEKLGKSVVAKVKIPEGTVLTLDMLTVKVGEPKGYPPEDIFNLVGKKVLVTVEEDDTIMEESVENHGKKIKS
ncbi:PREDICTED: sialic acid synthase [Propithecus coquereli]|uniref:sialic acid synthase n=1 Tax=Propithecus coquereli TaxID=379532 RepID=UPI00063F8637|nr:PREDICTED: sialic acid synthase [Propithecus coquereli]